MSYIYLLIATVFVAYNLTYILIPQECLPFYALTPQLIFYILSILFTIYHSILKKYINWLVKIGMILITILYLICNTFLIVYLNVYAERCETYTLTPQLWYLIHLYTNNVIVGWWIKLLREVNIPNYNKIRIQTSI